MGSTAQAVIDFAKGAVDKVGDAADRAGFGHLTDALGFNGIKPAVENIKDQTGLNGAPGIYNAQRTNIQAIGAAYGASAIAESGVFEAAGPGGVAESSGVAGGSLGSGASATPSAASSFSAKALETAGQAAASQVVGSILRPKENPPGVSPVTEMPDPLATEKARRRSLVEQSSRRGRASTIMTNPGSSGKLGG